jgi:quercetin dioxygenase-like cupin family protein
MKTEMKKEMAAVSLSFAQIGELDWHPVERTPGVQFKTLWRDPSGSSHAGLMRILAGASIPRHVHRHASHHVWVETGSLSFDARTFGPGAYLHVPIGVEHGVDAVGEGGCTFFYLYLTSAEPD